MAAGRGDGAKRDSRCGRTSSCRRPATLVTKVAPRCSARPRSRCCRRVDATAKPIIDAVLGAFGLLDDAPEPSVRLPLGLLHDPAGWLRHAGPRAASRRASWRSLDALKPILGLAASPASWCSPPASRCSVGAAGGDSSCGPPSTRRSSPRPRDPARPAGGRPDRRPCGSRARRCTEARARSRPRRGRRRAGGKAVHASLDGGAAGVPPARDRRRHRPLPGRARARRPPPARRIDAANHALPFLLNKLAAQTGNVALRHRRGAGRRGRRPPRPPRRHAAVHLRAARRLRRRSGRLAGRGHRRTLAAALASCWRRPRRRAAGRRRRAGRRPGAPASTVGPVGADLAGEPVPLRGHRRGHRRSPARGPRR